MPTRDSRVLQPGITGGLSSVEAIYIADRHISLRQHYMPALYNSDWKRDLGMIAPDGKTHKLTTLYADKTQGPESQIVILWVAMIDRLDPLHSKH